MKTYTGFVRHSNGQIYWQQPWPNQWGFLLASDDQTYPGGIGIGNGTWEPVSAKDMTGSEAIQANRISDANIEPELALGDEYPEA